MDDVVVHPDVAFGPADNAFMPLAKQRIVSADRTYIHSSREQIKDARALLEKELHDVELAAAYIRHRKNLLLPVSSLPVEILLHILLKLSGFEPTNNRGKTPAIVLATHVCRTWRAVALGCSGLWTHIPLQAGKKWTKAFLKRSGEATLSIPDMIGFPMGSWQWTLLRDEVGRIGRFHLERCTTSDVEAFLGICISRVPARLAEVVIKSDTTIQVLDPLDAIALRGAPLRMLVLQRISLPWDSFHWNNLRHVEIMAPPSNMDMSDFAVLASSLASAPFLEVLRLVTCMCPFKPPAKPTPAPTHVQLSRLRMFAFNGFAADFQQLSGVVHMPPTTWLDITLHSDERRAAEASLVTSIIRTHTFYGKPPQHKTIQALEIGASRITNTVRIQAWRSARELRPNYADTRGFVNVALILPTQSPDTMDVEALLLCQSIELQSLHHLRLTFPSDAGGNIWTKDAWHTHFLPATSVRSVDVSGSTPDAFFEALAAPADAAEPAPGRRSTRKQRQKKRILFPLLARVALSDVCVEATTMENYLRDRARHAPIGTLTLRECSVQRSTIEDLRGVKGLKVDWDEGLGEFAEYCEDCAGDGCSLCQSDMYDEEGCYDVDFY